MTHFPPESTDAAAILDWAIGAYGARFAIVTSFQSEGMVLIDMASRLGRPFRVITLDTGRLPAETFQMIETVREHYGVQVEVISPDAREVEQMVLRHGPNLFYRDVAYRRLCCHFRKVRPLERVLAGLEAYATGLRREQSETRAAVLKLDTASRPVKLNPLADWTRAEVDAYTRAHQTPRHPLYQQGYGSIGCAPCTRPLMPGEEERAGRWWWEQDAAKECGLHFTPEGKTARTLDILVGEILSAHA